MQSLGLIVALTLLNFIHTILAIAIQLGGTLTKKVVLCYMQKSKSTFCEN